MSAAAASPEKGYRDNPGFLVRTYRGRDRIFPVLNGGLAETLFAIAEVSRGSEPIPFAWIGQCNLVVGEPEAFEISDLVDAASEIEGVPYPVNYDTSPDSLMGQFMIAPGGVVRRILVRDQLGREWNTDDGAVASLLRLLKILLHEGCLMRNTRIDWRWRPDTYHRDIVFSLGTAEQLL